MLPGPTGRSLPEAPFPCTGGEILSARTETLPSGLCQKLLVKASLPKLFSSELESVNEAIVDAGGWIERQDKLFWIWH